MTNMTTNEVEQTSESKESLDSRPEVKQHCASSLPMIHPRTFSILHRLRRSIDVSFQHHHWMDQKMGMCSNMLDVRGVSGR